MPGKRHTATEETRKLAENAAGIGLPHEQIATLLGITDKTLRKKYRHELDSGKAKANFQIGGKLYKEALAGNATLLIWWTKTQMSWKGESALQLKTPPGQPLEHRHTYGSPELLKQFYAEAEAASSAALSPGGGSVGEDDTTGD